MHPSATNDYCLAMPGKTYAIYLPDGGTTDLLLAAGTYDVKWYDPRTGGNLQDGTVTSVAGPGSVSIGRPPYDTGADWAVLVVAKPRFADLNDDGCVTFEDLAIMAADWLRCNDPADPRCEAVTPNPIIEAADAGPTDLQNGSGAKPITSVQAGQDGSPPYLLESIAVGGYTVTVDQLATGTSTIEAQFDTEADAADDFDLNNIVARNNPPGGNLWQITLIDGKSTWSDINGDNPDFFIFEAGMNDDITVWAILAGGALGQPVHIPSSTWGDTGLHKAGSPNNGQSIGGIAFGITELLDPSGLPLTADTLIEGIQVESGTLDPSCFCAIASPGLLSDPPVVDAGPDMDAVLQSGTVMTFQLDGTATDDGMPAALTVKWTVDSQAEGSAVQFEPYLGDDPAVADIVNPAVSVDTVGTYVLRLTANDGESSAYDQVTLTLAEPCCEYVRRHGLLLETDLSGPDGIPDCRVDGHDFAFLAGSWLAAGEVSQHR